ncbi:hypothetical protein [Qipengyuania sphaerica]|uniref:hypothetical protein n=1 Tax=Qipengyuania sphaerica TaxID=2867243 RepID=UPI001C87D8C6|nr:hypothetical protein [Qipengyuania sphaerica]MBX7539533.1 hypothetical protein [Qipengyuania sphaerica]
MKIIAPLVALALAAPALAQEDAPASPQLSLEQATNLRCGVVFGTVAAAQDRGEEAALELPAMKERGREFFVRTTAQLMDDENLDRDAVKALVFGQVEEIVATDFTDVAEEFPACLLLLEASGL